MTFKSGFVALVGKPNVGKSTLLNALVGSKVAITSPQPQTTRRRMLGVVHRKDFQIVLVDTPGLSAPHTELGKRMVGAAQSESRDADVVLFLGEITHPPTDQDRAAIEMLGKVQAPVFLVGSKLDKAKRPEEALELYKELRSFDEVIPISALKGTNLPALLKAITDRLQEGPPYYPPDQVSDQNDRLLIEEVVREKVLLNTRQEVPHAVAVQVEEMREGYAAVNLYVEREGQKRILIGKGGSVLKKIGQLAREELELLLGRKLFLELWVKVKADWRDRPDWLRSLGYE